MKITPGTIESEGHVVLTGPISGSITLEDGTTYDVSAPVVEVAPEHADELADLIGKHYAENGHPAVPVSDENPEGFTYDAPKRTTKKKG